MINPNKESILFIQKNEKKLSDGFWHGVEQALEAIYEGTGIRYKSFNEHKSEHPRTLTFAYYFDLIHRKNGNIGELSEKRITQIYTWLISSITNNNHEERTRGICLINNKGDSRIVKSGAESVAFGLRLVLLSMKRQGLILLPYEFRLPSGNKWLYRSNYLDKFFSPITKFFLSMHKDTPDHNRPTENPVMRHYMEKSKNNPLHINMFSSTAITTLLCFSANTITELSIRDFVRVSYLSARRCVNPHAKPVIFKNENFPATRIPLEKILKALTYQYPTESTFTTSEFKQLLFSYKNLKRHKASWVARRKLTTESGDRRSLEYLRGGPPKKKKHSQKNTNTVYIAGNNRLETAQSAIMPINIYEVSEQEIYEHCLQLDTKYFAPKNIQHTLKHIPWKVDKKAIDYWVEIIDIYKKTKLRNRQTAKTEIRKLGVLFLYLFFYLPRWFDHHKDSKLSFPNTVDKLDPIIFGSSPLEPDCPVPKTFITYMNDRADTRSISDQTLRPYLDNVYNLFNWITKSGKKYIKHCSNPQLLFDRDDLPLSTSLRGTTKNIFPKKLFKTVVSYAYAVLEFKEHIQQLLEEGEISYKDLRSKNSKLNTLDFGFVPKVFHLGREYKVEEIPSQFLRLNDLEYKDGRTVDSIHLGPIIHNILMLETGLRGRHIQWLDDATFDIEYNDLELKRPMYPLSVKTDKRGHSWTPFVSPRVIKLLRKLSAWKKSIADPAFYLEVDYNHEKTYYGKFNSVFASNNSKKLGPISDNNYRDSWHAMCLGLQLFLNKNNIDKFTFIKYVPTGAKKFKQRYTEKECEIKDNEDYSQACGLFCPVSLRPFVSPHGARATVISNNISHLPADIIGKYITGQTERVIFYYAKTTVEDIDELVALHKDRQYPAPKEFIQRNAHDAVMLYSEQVNHDFRNSIGNADQLDDVIESYGMISLDSLIEKNVTNPTGIELVQNSNSAEIAFNTSHICPFGNICPKEIVKQYGETGLCGICSYSIKSVDHLPAISAAKHVALEKLDGLNKTLVKACKAKSTDDVIYDLERRRDNQAFNILGWELSEDVLNKKLKNINIGSAEGRFTSFQPQIVSECLERIYVDNNDANYLICRLKECIAYPSLESEQIKAQFEKAKHKLLVASGDLSGIFKNTPSLDDPAGELYSLVTSMMEVKGISTNKILEILESDIHDFMQHIEVSPRLLGETNV